MTIAPFPLGLAILGALCSRPIATLALALSAIVAACIPGGL